MALAPSAWWWGGHKSGFVTSLGSVSPHLAALGVGSVSLDPPHSTGVDVRWGLSGLRPQPSVSSEVFVAADSPAAARDSAVRLFPESTWTCGAP